MPSSSTNTRTTPTSASDSRLSIWLKKLPKNPLPINLSIANDVLRLLQSEHCDLHRLASLIRQDPLLCLKLFHRAESAIQARDGGIQHLEHMLGLMGLNHVEQTVTSSRKYHNQRLDEGFHEILSASVFAAELSCLMLSRYEGNIDRFFLPALLFNSPLWFMWIAAPKTMSHGQTIASRHRQSFIAISVKKLGFKLPDLLEQADKFVKLPSITQQALRINPTKDRHFWAKVHRLSDARRQQWFDVDKVAQQFFYSMEVGIYLINQYAIAVYFDYDGKHRRRYSDLLACYLNISIEELHHKVHTITDNITTPKAWAGSLSPQYRLRGEHRIEENIATQHGAAIPKPSISDWCSTIKQSSDANEAITTTFKALTQGVGVEHCIILEVEPHDLHTQSCYGFESNAGMGSFHFDWEASNNVFKQLSQKPACLQLHANDLPKAAQRFPKEFTSKCDLKPCALLSVFEQQKPKAIIYCDHQEWNNEKHQAFKTIGKQLSHTLRHL